MLRLRETWAQHKFLLRKTWTKKSEMNTQLRKQGLAGSRLLEGGGHFPVAHTLLPFLCKVVFIGELLSKSFFLPQGFLFFITTGCDA